MRMTQYKPHTPSGVVMETGTERQVKSIKKDRLSPPACCLIRLRHTENRYRQNGGTFE